MKQFLVLALVTGLLLLAGVCSAYPSLFGPSGGVNVPTATVVSHGQWALGADISDTLTGRALVGIAPNAEIGVGNFNSDTWQINGKYVWQHVGQGTSVAAGIVQEFGSGSETHVYGVATHVFSTPTAQSPGISGSLGLELSNHSSLDPFVDLNLTFQNRLTLVADASRANLAVAARYPLNRPGTLVGEVGYSSGLFVGATYYFNGQ